MFTHEDIWRAIDRLAEEKGFSASGLARQAGLDPTAFNRSKRISPNGKPRWPSTESLAKILQVTDSSLNDLLLAMAQGEISTIKSIPHLPYQAVRTGQLSVEKNTPSFLVTLNASESSYAMTVEDERLKPLYRAGSILVIDPLAAMTADDRVLLFSRKDGLRGGILRTSAKRVWTILLPEQNFQEMTFPEADIDWIARIVWASQ